MKIDEIRPREHSEQQRRAYLQDVDTYTAIQHLFTARDCPGCLSSNSDFFSKHHSFSFSQCNSCFTIFMNPAPTQDMVDNFYRNSSNYEYWSKEIYPNTRKSRRLTIHRDRADFVLDINQKFRGSTQIRKVLEIGAGTGDSLSVLKQLYFNEIETYAVEPNLSMLESLQANGIEVLSDVSDIKDIKFDIILGFEVLEHFLKPDDFFLMCKSILTDEGLIIISTPNAHSFEVQLLRDKSSTLDIEHISVLTPTAMHCLATRHGFKVEQISTPGNFDLELIETGSIQVKIEDGAKVLTREEIQALVSRFGFSSHMKIALSRE